MTATQAGMNFMKENEHCMSEMKKEFMERGIMYGRKAEVAAESRRSCFSNATDAQG